MPIRPAEIDSPVARIALPMIERETVRTGEGSNPTTAAGRAPNMPAAVAKTRGHAEDPQLHARATAATPSVATTPRCQHPASIAQVAHSQVQTGVRRTIRPGRGAGVVIAEARGHGVPVAGHTEESRLHARAQAAAPTVATIPRCPNAASAT